MFVSHSVYGEKETDRQTDTETDRQTHRETDRHTEGEFLKNSYVNNEW